MVINCYQLTDEQRAEIGTWDVFGFPSVSDRRALPKDPGVYFLIVGNEVLYIGRTWRLDVRWRSHTHKSHLDRPNARIAFLTIAKQLASVRGEVERLFIKRFNPPLNKLGRKGDVPSPGEISIPS